MLKMAKHTFWKTTNGLANFASNKRGLLFSSPLSLPVNVFPMLYRPNNNFFFFLVGRINNPVIPLSYPVYTIFPRQLLKTRRERVGFQPFDLFGDPLYLIFRQVIKVFKNLFMEPYFEQLLFVRRFLR